MKKILVLGGVAIVVVVIFLFVGLSNIGPLIKKAVNTAGPEITKTKINIGDVRISIFSGEARIKDFLLGNPKGFKTPEAMKVATIKVDIDEGSITGDTIVINRIEITKPEITYEKSGATDNFKAILNNVTQSAKAVKHSRNQAEKKQGKEKGTRLLIKNFIVTDGKVSLAMDLLGGKSISAPLPDIHLKDIGKENNGATPAKAFEIIFQSLYNSICADAVTNIFTKDLKELGVFKDMGVSGVKIGGEVAHKAVKSIAGELESAADKIKGLFSTD